MKKEGQPYELSGAGLSWPDVKQHEGRWDKLPA